MYAKNELLLLTKGKTILVKSDPQMSSSTANNDKSIIDALANIALCLITVARSIQRVCQCEKRSIQKCITRGQNVSLF